MYGIGFGEVVIIATVAVLLMTGDIEPMENNRRIHMRERFLWRRHLAHMRLLHLELLQHSREKGPSLTIATVCIFVLALCVLVQVYN